MSATVELATEAGRVSGLIDGGVVSFKGIPYAAAPVGPLRFAPPERPPAWGGVRPATEYGPIAPQLRGPLDRFMGTDGRPISEDCLTLNVWTPGCDDLDVDALPGGRAMGYLLILAIEELLDVCNRATMRDETVHPLSRQIARIHVLEEARHVSFAKAYLAEAWPQLSEQERTEAAAVAPIAVEVVAQLMVNDDVAPRSGSPTAREAARANPHHRARIVGDLAKLVDFLTELGVVDATNRHEWTDRGLAAA